MSQKPMADQSDIAALRDRITGLVARNAVAMVQCAIDAVMEEGQFQAIKYLFEMVGIYPMAAGQSDEPDDTLAKVLLRHLGVPAAEADQAVSDSPDDDIHPVK